jgi:hypothetical protein
VSSCPSPIQPPLDRHGTGTIDVTLHREDVVDLLALVLQLAAEGRKAQG